MREIKVNRIYKHFKGNYYLVLALAKNSEDLKDYVVYKSLNDEKVWIREFSMFASKVDKVKYPNSKQKYRFELWNKSDLKITQWDENPIF